MARQSTFVPRAVGVAVGVGVLVVFIAATLLFGLMDMAFDYGGKAPMALAVLGAACTMGGYWGGEAVTRRLM
ncbi:MAG: hypothetical protein AB8I08_11735 [Sandaracinaceae bacterium]